MIGGNETGALLVPRLSYKWPPSNADADSENQLLPAMRMNSCIFLS